MVHIDGTRNYSKAYANIMIILLSLNSIRVQSLNQLLCKIHSALYIFNLSFQFIFPSKINKSKLST